MNKVKFTKGDSIKICICHPGTKEALLASGWVEFKDDEEKNVINQVIDSPAIEEKVESKPKSKIKSKAKGSA